jgi:hypothetical protein
MRDRIRGVNGGAAPFVAPWVTDPYAIHFFTYEVGGLDMHGRPELAWAELVAVIEGDDGFELISPDVLHDLTPVQVAPRELEAPDPDEVRRASNHVRAVIQIAERKRVSEERSEQAQLRSEYLRVAMDAERRALQDRWTSLEERVWRGEEAAKLARDEAERRLQELERRREEKLRAFEGLGVVRPGPVSYVGSALVGPVVGEEQEVARPMREDSEVEQAAMRQAMEAEREQGREVVDVSHFRDGRGFDLRSWVELPDGRVSDVRRIEVKGRSASRGDISLCRTEWIAANRHRESFWLYVVYAAGTDQERLVRIQDPAAVFGQTVQEHVRVTTYLVPGEAIEAVA